MIKIDLHSHSSASHDSYVSPKCFIECYQKKGFGGVAVTDHNTIHGAQEIARLAPKNFWVIIGEEITSKEGEIIGYFLKEKIPRDLGARETIAQIKKQGGVVAIPHPCDRMRHHVLERKILFEIIHDVDFIEIFNARNVFKNDNQKAYELAKKYQKNMSAGSDAHSTLEIGNVSLEIDKRCDDRETFLSQWKDTAPKINTHSAPLFVHGITRLVKWYKKYGHQ